MAKLTDEQRGAKVKALSAQILEIHTKLTALRKEINKVVGPEPIESVTLTFKGTTRTCSIPVSPGADTVRLIASMRYMANNCANAFHHEIAVLATKQQKLMEGDDE